MKKIIIYLMAISHCVAISQTMDTKRDNIWCWGYGYSAPIEGINVLDFNASQVLDTLLPFVGGVELDATNASVSDTSGNLLFYTNGIKVINKNHELMENGDSLTFGHYSFEYWYPNYGYNTIQGAMILTVPESKDLYYLIYSAWDIAPSLPEQIICPSILYATVDMSKNGGLGKVIRKDQILINDTIGIPNVAACRHANGRDWWLLFKDFRQHRFHRVLLTSDGLIVESPIDFGGNRMDMWCQTVFSPDGKLFIQGGLEAGTMQSPFHLHKYDFDRCTGMLSNYWHFQDNEPFHYTGCTISPNSRYLYYSSQANKVYQLDLQASDIIASRQLVAVSDTFTDGYIYPFTVMQLAPDNKIYTTLQMVCLFFPSCGLLICRNLSRKPSHYFRQAIFRLVYIQGGQSELMHIIHQPDVGGIACSVSVNVPLLAARASFFSLPNFPYFRLGAEVGTICDSLTVGISAPFGSAQGAVYPNPADETVTLSVPLSETAVFALMDLQGREILRRLVRDKESVFVANLPTGAYFYKIENMKGNAYGKLWIVR